MSTIDITSRAMLVDLTIEYWQARRFDPVVTDEVAINHNTSTSAGRYNKNLFPQNPREYAAVTSAAGAARREHYAQTLPWSDKGPRILPSANFDNYTNKMRVARSTVEQSWLRFVADYSRIVNDARPKLNGMFRESDYPHESQIASEFTFRTSVIPVPAAGDFRVQLGADAVAAIQRQIECDVNRGVNGAMRDTVNRLRDVLGAMCGKLKDTEAIFRDSLFGNVKELCDLLPNLNLTDDPQLDSVIEAVRKQVLTFSPQECRDDVRMRQEAAARVQAIMSDLGAMYK